MGINRGLRGAASCLALAMFGVALTAERAAAAEPIGVICSFYEGAVAAALAIGETNFAPEENACVSLSTSTTEHDTITTVILPGDTVVAPGAPQLQTQLGQVLAGPNGLQILNALGAVSGPPILTFIERQSNGDAPLQPEDVTLEETIGLYDRTIVFIGPNRSVRFYVFPEANHLNVNTEIEHLFTDIFQAAIKFDASSVDWLSGDLHTTFQTVLLDDGFGFTDTLLLRGRRSAGPSGSIIAAADGGDALEASLGDGWSTWSKSAYRTASFDDTASNFGFAADGFSSAYGLDHAGGDWVTGVAVGYSTLTSKQDVTGDKGDLQAFKAGLYASYHPGDWTITGSATGSILSIKSKRLVTLPTPATAKYDAASFNLGLEAARRFDLTETAFFEPTGGFIYSNLHTDGFTESGGGGLGLSVDDESTDALKAYVGARLASTMNLNDGMTITPELRGRVVYDVLGDNRDLTASFAGVPAATPFAVTGLEPSRFGGIIGAGLTLASTTNWQATISYDAEIRGGDVLHTARGGFTWAF